MTDTTTPESVAMSGTRGPTDAGPLSDGDCEVANARHR